MRIPNVDAGHRNSHELGYETNANMDITIDQLHSRLRGHYGLQSQADFVRIASVASDVGTSASTVMLRERTEASALATLLRALLSGSTEREYVERALGNLREAGLFDLHALVGAPPEELADLIRPVGAVRQKASRLRRVLRYAIDRHDGSLKTMFATQHEDLRRELSAINGVGRETADTILLEAAGVPLFVVDIHSHRVFKRHGWIEFEADGEAVRELCESGLQRDSATLGEFHVLIARVGREHCRKAPRCDGCPLADLLPDGGPLEAIS
ncbi:MAG TPA: endonuclease III domain-containing protein [Pirellulales bacterium]|nr:endonuclease III domain-containing protein [Pirellulales bacterium]